MTRRMLAAVSPLLLIILLPIALRRSEVSDDATAGQLVIISPHNEAIRHEFESAFRRYSVENYGEAVDIDWRTPGGTSDIVRYIKSKNLQNPVIVSPDTGGVKAAYAYSQMLGCGLAIAAKQRKGPDEVEAWSLVGDVEGCTAIMVDDLTTTAGTLCSAADLVKKNGGGDIYAAVTHATITPLGIERLKESPIKELVVTDTVPMNDGGEFPITVLSVAELLGEAIVRIHEDQSVTSLFRP